MNQPDRVGQWVLQGQEMEIVDDAKLPGSILVKLYCSDHTIGNLLRSQLLLDKNVLFAGYRLPHPSHNYVELRIQTDPNMTPYVSPRKAMWSACIALANMTKDLRKQFETQATDQELAATARAQGAAAGGLPQGGDAYGQGAGFDAYGGGNAAGGGIATEDPYAY